MKAEFFIEEARSLLRLLPEVQLLLGALVGCEQATAKFVAAKMRLPAIRRIEFLVRKKMANRKSCVAVDPKRFRVFQKCPGSRFRLNEMNGEAWLLQFKSHHLNPVGCRGGG